MMTSYRSSDHKQQPRYPAERSDLQCGDCSALLQLRETPKGTFYGCTRYPACRGCVGAHPDGSPVGTPADAATRRARHLTHELFDKLWRDGYMSRMGAYTWMQEKLGMSVDEAHIGQFDIPTCRRLYALVRDYLRLLSADPLHQERAKLRLALISHFGHNKRARRRAHEWLGGVLGIKGGVRIGELSREHCYAANVALMKVQNEQFWGVGVVSVADADDGGHEYMFDDEPLPTGCD